MSTFSASKTHQGSPTRHSAAIAILGGAQISLTLLERISECVPVPFIKAAAGTAVELVRIIRAIQSNKEECEDLLKRSASLLVVILHSLGGKAESDISEELKSRVERLVTAFYEVRTTLEEVKRRNAKRRALVYYFDNAEKLKGCSAQLDWAIQEFEVMSQVDACFQGLQQHAELRNGQVQLQDGQAQIRNDLREIRDAFNEQFLDLAHNQRLTGVPRQRTANVALSLPSVVMPADPRIFGREEYVEKAVDLLHSQRSTRIAILGSGGMGKTSVALKIIYHTRVIEKFGMCRYWVACEQATSVLLLIELLAKLLKIPTSTSSDRFSDVVTFLESSNVLIVFLFDNFETPWDIEGQRSDVGYVLARLASIPTVSIIITMRGNQCPYEESIDWSHPRLPSLTPLDLGAAEKAFTRISSKSAGNAELHTLLRELDCVPLAITLMAKLASGGESVHELVLQWRTERTRLLGQTGGDRCTCIEVSIKLSIDSQAVKANQGAIILLGILAMLPGGAAVSRLPDMCPSIPGWKAALRVLLKAALVYHNSDKSFVHVLSPIRSYVMLHHPLGEVALADLRASYCKLAGKGASEPGDPDFLTNAKQLAIEETNIDAILLEGLQGQEGDISSAISASLNYSEYLYWTQPRTNIMEAATKVAKITQNTKLGDCLKLLGRIQQLQTHYDAAKTTLKEAQAEYYRIGDRLGAAHCLKSQGQILQLQTQYDAAQDALKEAQIEYVGLGNRLGAAHCLKSRGQILQIQTQYDAARETLKEAQAEYVSLGDHLGAANCLFSLGEIFQTQKQHDEAQEALKSAQDKYTSLGDHLGVANCLRSLGQILQSQGQYDAAQAALKEAHTEYVGLGNHLGAAHTLKSLSQILRTQKLYDAAQTALKDAQAEYASLGNRLGEANCLKSLGVIHEEQSHYDASFNALKEAHAIYSALNNRLGMANCLSKMGRISRIQSRFTDACKQLEEARVLYSAAGQAKWAQWCTKQSYLASRKRNAA